MRHVVRLIGIVCLGLVALHAGPAHAEKRVALVIGNSAYRAVAELPNPKKDARDIAAALRGVGFAEVMERYDLGVRDLRQALSTFEDRTLGADWAVVYYAGHGIEMDGRNYLVPVDAELKRASDVEDETLALDRVLARAAGAGRLQLVILDACRDNPFRRRMVQVGGAKRAVGERGLARVEPTHPNLIVAYAARDGEVALDGKAGDNSPYARALVKYLAEPGLELGRFFRSVRVDVMAETGGQQRPFEYGSLTEDLFFKPAMSEVERAWAAVKDSGSIAALQAFRRQYAAANPGYDRLAGAQIDGLKQRAREDARTGAEAERQRLALLQQQEDERRRKSAEEADMKPGRAFRDCAECPEMVVVPAGSFMMGSVSEAGDFHEGPQHRVTIARPFAVGKFEVTRGEFAALIRESGRPVGDRCHVLEGGRWEERAGRSFRDPAFAQDDRHPAVCVNWEDATAFAGWLSKKTGKTYRLLSEAEWEYAARAGNSTRYHFGDKEQDLCAYGNVADQTAGQKYEDWTKTANCRDGHINTAPVGSFQPNAFGLYDMHGNVWEWVQDCWNSGYGGAPEYGSAWTAGATLDCGRRVLRGGSWSNEPRDLRSAKRASNRVRNTTDDRVDNVGFRVGRTL